MATNVGTYNIDDLRAVRFASAGTFGTDTINETLQRDLNYYNEMVREQLAMFASPVTVQQMVYGTSGLLDFVEMDEFGLAPTRKVLPGQTVAFPLKLFKSAWGVTSKYLEIATPAEIAEKYLMVRRGDAANITREIKKAIYNNTNYSVVDKLTNGVTLGVKRFINADSSTIPNSPAGATFDGSSHTHFFGTSSGSYANADIDSVVSTVTEHGNTQGLVLVVALAEKATVSALSNFSKLVSPLMTVAQDTATPIQKLDITDLENQMIGLWNGTIPVWVKPYAVSGYIACMATGMPEKPLAFRQREQVSLQGLRLAAEFKEYPLVSENFENEFGIGVHNRLAGAVLSKTSAWANPTIS